MDEKKLKQLDGIRDTLGGILLIAGPILAILKLDTNPEVKYWYHRCFLIVAVPYIVAWWTYVIKSRLQGKRVFEKEVNRRLTYIVVCLSVYIIYLLYKHFA
jgi:hypothetical protein